VIFSHKISHLVTTFFPVAEDSVPCSTDSARASE